MTGAEGTILGTQFTASAVAVFFINFLKGRSWFPWVTAQTPKFNRLIALVTSGAAALGIHVVWAPGTLTITGLTLTGIIGGAWLWIKSFAIQEWIYQSSKQNSAASKTQPVAPAPAAAPATVK